MKTTWNHPAKKQALAWFLFCAFVTLLYGALALSFKELRTPGLLGYLAVFVMLGGLFGYRAFFRSDDWFRMQEEKSADFWRKYPRWEIAITIVIWGVLLAATFGPDIWRHFHKH